MDCTLGWPSSSSACCSVNHRTAAAQQPQHNDPHSDFHGARDHAGHVHKQHALYHAEVRISTKDHVAHLMGLHGYMVLGGVRLAI